MLPNAADCAVNPLTAVSRALNRDMARSVAAAKRRARTSQEPCQPPASWSSEALGPAGSADSARAGKKRPAGYAHSPPRRRVPGKTGEWSAGCIRPGRDRQHPNQRRRPRPPSVRPAARPRLRRRRPRAFWTRSRACSRARPPRPSSRARWPACPSARKTRSRRNLPPSRLPASPPRKMCPRRPLQPPLILPPPILLAIRRRSRPRIRCPSSHRLRRRPNSRVPTRPPHLEKLSRPATWTSRRRRGPGFVLAPSSRPNPARSRRRPRRRRPRSSHQPLSCFRRPL